VVDDHELNLKLLQRVLELEGMHVVAAASIRAAALAAGCDAYVSKPIDTRAFAALVSSMLHSSSRAYAAH
jgi:CheY-like chemotaxis protein